MVCSAITGCYDWVIYKEKGFIKLSVPEVGKFKVGMAYLVKDFLLMGTPW